MSDTSGVAGVGQLDPEDTASEFNGEEFRIRQILASIGTATLATVLSVTGGRLESLPRVSVQPAVNQVDGAQNATAHGEVHDIPAIRQQGGKNAVICDPVEGDVGLLVTCSRDISSVKKNAGVANPGSQRQFDISDSVFIGLALGGVADQYVYFREDGITSLDKNGNTTVTTPDGVTTTDANGNVIVTSDQGISLTDLSGQSIVTTPGQITLSASLIKINGVLEADGISGNAGTIHGDLHVLGSVTVDDAVGVGTSLGVGTTVVAGGEGTFGGHTVGAHVHPGVVSGPSDTAPPTG